MSKDFSNEVGFFRRHSKFLVQWVISFMLYGVIIAFLSAVLCIGLWCFAKAWRLFVSALVLTMVCPCPAQVAAQSVAGTASWYGDECRGRLMANGKPFDPEAMTCASWQYPLGTRLVVSTAAAQVTVTVTDRGPAKRLVKQGRVIDLSRAAFRKISDDAAGLILVRIVPVTQKEKDSK